MKKFILGFIVGILLVIPIFVFSASNLAEKLKGKILLAVEDKGKTYYVYEDGNRYRITKDTAQAVFENLALGITNENLEKIPLKELEIIKPNFMNNSKNEYTKSISKLTSEELNRKTELQNKEKITPEEFDEMITLQNKEKLINNPAPNQEWLDEQTN